MASPAPRLRKAKSQTDASTLEESVSGRLEPVSAERDALPSSIWALVIAFRVFNALSVTTFFQPDEFFQSLEVAHNFVFGYGYLTWEWRERIRSFFHPAIFAAVYKLLSVLGLASVNGSLVGF